MKRAYTDAALRFHPDRLSDSSADAHEVAEFRMREVNEAWSVLRSPAARARYDDALREAVTPVQVGAGAGQRSPWEAPTGDLAPIRLRRMAARPADVAPEVTSLAPADPRVRPVPVKRRWRRFAPLIVGAVALLALLVASVLARTRDDAVRVQTVEQFAVGTCVGIVIDPAAATTEPGVQAQPTIVALPCDGPRSGKVVDKVPFPKPCPQGSRAHLVPGEDESLCLVP